MTDLPIIISFALVSKLLVPKLPEPSSQAGAWELDEPDAWELEKTGAWELAAKLLIMEHGAWSMEHGAWSMEHGARSTST